MWDGICSRDNVHVRVCLNQMWIVFVMIESFLSLSSLTLSTLSFDLLFYFLGLLQLVLVI